MKQRSDKLAFVLSGGGSLGSIQVGCLKALLDEWNHSRLDRGDQCGCDKWGVVGQISEFVWHGTARKDMVIRKERRHFFRQSRYTIIEALYGS